MNKKVFITMSLLALISYFPIQADFSCKQFLQATQQKIASTSTFLVDNAWRIAGTTSFVTAAVTTAIIARATLKDAQFTQSLTSILPQNAIRLLFPLGCSIFGLLCFNVHQQIQKNTLSDELCLNILDIAQKNREESLSIQARAYINEVNSLHNN